MEVAQHYSKSNDSSEPESSCDFPDPGSPKKVFGDPSHHLSSGTSAVNNSMSADGMSAVSAPSEFAAAAAAAAAAAMASEDFRSHSIAALRARAQQHSARLQQSPNSAHIISLQDWSPSAAAAAVAAVTADVK